MRLHNSFDHVWAWHRTYLVLKKFYQNLEKHEASEGIGVLNPSAASRRSLTSSISVCFEDTKIWSVTWHIYSDLSRVCVQHQTLIKALLFVVEYGDGNLFCKRWQKNSIPRNIMFLIRLMNCVCFVTGTVNFLCARGRPSDRLMNILINYWWIKTIWTSFTFYTKVIFFDKN